MNLPSKLTIEAFFPYLESSGDHKVWEEMKDSQISDDIKKDFEGSKHAAFEFPNGYGASLICGKMFYSNGIDTYELALLHSDKVAYDFPPFEHDVLGHQTLDEVLQVLLLIMNHEPKPQGLIE